MPGHSAQAVAALSLPTQVPVEGAAYVRSWGYSVRDIHDGLCYSKSVHEIKKSGLLIGAGWRIRKFAYLKTNVNNAPALAH